MSPTPRQHQWFTISRHHSADGLVRYQRCPCGRWRTLLGTEQVWAQQAPCHRLTAV